MYRTVRVSALGRLAVFSAAILSGTSVAAQGPATKTAQRKAQAGEVATGTASLSALRARFASESKLEKQAAAGELLKLGDPDRVAWKYLAGEATAVLDKDAPFPLDFTPDGRLIPKKLSADFSRWARARGLEPEKAANDSIYSDAGDILVLTYTGDRRAMPILQRALHSRNYMIQVVAAKGLGFLKEKSATPEIVLAAHKAPREFSAVLAQGLLYFDDPYALSEAKKFIADPKMVEMLLKLHREHPEQAF